LRNFARVVALVLVAALSLTPLAALAIMLSMLWQPLA